MSVKNDSANFRKLRELIEAWVKPIPHTAFLFFTEALNEYFENDKTYSTVYAKRVFLSRLREASDCWDLEELFSKADFGGMACLNLLCSDMALNNRPLFFPLLKTLDGYLELSDEDFEQISMVYKMPDEVKAEDLLCETSVGEWAPVKREPVAPEKRFTNPEYNLTGSSMIVYKI